MMKPPQNRPPTGRLPQMIKAFHPAIAAMALLLATGAGAAQAALQPDSTAAGWHLVWSDEFNQPDGSAPDPAKWGLETGGNGWGNNELEH